MNFPNLVNKNDVATTFPHNFDEDSPIKVEIHLYPKPKSPIGSKIVFAVMFKNLICPRLGQQKAHAGFHALLKTKIFNFFSVGGQCTAKKGRQIKRKGWSSW